MAPLKVLHVITGLSVGGAEMMLQKVLSGLEPHGFRNSVVSLSDEGPLAASIRRLNVPVYPLRLQDPAGRWAGLQQLASLLRRQRPNIVQTWLYHADLMGFLFGKLTGIPHVVWNLRCSNMENMKPRTVWTLKACARLSRCPSAVVVNSEEGRAFHARLGYRPRRWVVIPNGFDLARFAPDAEARRSVRDELGIPRGAVVVGLVARFDPMKDHECFLRAAQHLARVCPDVHYVLAGREVVPGNPRLSPLLREHPAPGCLHLLGERSDVPRLLAAMDIVASSSSYGEGFSNSIGEAMACGVPCVVTDVGDSAAIVGETGIVAQPRCPERLADGWRQLIEVGAQKREELGRRSRQRVCDHYSLEAVVRQYEELYCSLSQN